MGGVFATIGILFIFFKRSPNISFDFLLVLLEILILLAIFMVNKCINGLEKFLRQNLFLTHTLNVVVFLALRFSWYIRTRSTCTRC